MIKNYGFLLNEIEDPKAYKLGSVELPKIVIREDGQYDDFLPSDELQYTPNFDTYGCTIFGTENIQQTLERVHYGKSSEYDERYNYNLVEIIPPGADPHDAAESFRKDGVISGQLPMTETSEEFSKPRPMPTKYVSLGIAHPYELRHQWLWRSPRDKTTRTKLIKEYLRYGPLGVSVTAWEEENGVYVDRGLQNTHWTILYGWNEKGWKIYDSYPPHKKVLSYDHNIESCKRYQLIPNTRKEQSNLIQQWLNLLLQWLGLIRAKNEPQVPPRPLIEPVVTLIPEPVPKPPKYLWGTKEEARHSVRVICDEEGLSVNEKNLICAVIECESGFDTKAVHKNNDARKSVDYGLCQYNSFWYIGEGKPIASVDEALNNPERCVRVMIQQFRNGRLKDWVCFSSNRYKKFIKK